MTLVPELEAKLTLQRMYKESKNYVLRYDAEYRKLSAEPYFSDRQYQIVNKRLTYLKNMIIIHKKRLFQVANELKSRQLFLR